MTIYIEEIAEGMSRERARKVTAADIDAFARVSGDFNPVHLDPTFAEATPFRGVIAHGMLTAAMISAVIGEELPGPGAIYMSQSLKFRAPVRPGDEVRAVCSIAKLCRERRRVWIDCACLVGDAVVLEGEALVLAPSREACVAAA